MNAITSAKTLAVLVTNVYRHFQGSLIQVIKIVEDTNTNEKLVLYSAITTPGDWQVLPISQFLDSVESEGNRVPRFAITDIRIGTVGGLLLGSR